MTSGDLDYSIRDFNPETDYSALAALCAAVESADAIGEEVSEEALRASGVRRWVAETKGQWVAHGLYAAQTPIRIFVDVGVHPGWRRMGLGTAMLAYGLRLAKESGAGQMVCNVQVDNATALAFLQQNGFVVAGHDRIMVVGAEAPYQAPVWPHGFTVRNMAEIDDLAVLAEAHNRCYSDRWGHSENTRPASREILAQWAEKMPDAFIPAGIFIVFNPAGQIAGVCYGRLRRDESAPGANPGRVVDSPGVAPDYRHLGLQRPLAQLTLQWLNTQGDGPLELVCFGDDEQTAAVYEELGFRLKPKNHWIENVRYLA